jgi:hypothetical protein
MRIKCEKEINTIIDLENPGHHPSRFFNIERDIPETHLAEGEI